jgi:prolyl 4-hydroxylase
VASFLLYLTDVEEGGETMFPYEVSARNFLYVFLLADCNEYCAGLQNSENMDIGYDYEKCIGLKVKPRKGDGLLFYSLMVNGTIDRVRAGLSKWPCTCASRSLSCTRSRTHVRSFI